MLGGPGTISEGIEAWVGPLLPKGCAPEGRPADGSALGAEGRSAVLPCPRMDVGI